jgi:putative transposase
MNVINYPDDLTDEEWAYLKEEVERDYRKGGRPLTHSKRTYLNAIFYWLRTGCQWRYLPHDFPPWQSVYTQFRRWKLEGLFERLENKIRQRLRQALNRTKQASAGIVDSQSVKTTDRGGVKGYDGGKKVKGRKRHILVDTQGFIISCVVTPANENDRKGLRRLLDKLPACEGKIKKIWGDLGYSGEETRALASSYGIELERVKSAQKGFWIPKSVTNIASYLKKRGIEMIEGFQVEPKRWIVERTFAWLSKYRRLSKDYEYLVTTSETILLMAMIRTMIKRLGLVTKKRV